MRKEIFLDKYFFLMEIFFKEFLYIPLAHPSEIFPLLANKFCRHITYKTIIFQEFESPSNFFQKKRGSISWNTVIYFFLNIYLNNNLTFII